MNFQTMNKQRKFILIAAFAGVIAVFLPWTTISVGFLGYGASQSMNGFHGYGIVVFIAFVVAGIVNVLGTQTEPLDKTTWLIAICAGLAALLFTIIAMQSGTGSMGFVDAKAGFGIWIAIAASLAVIAFAWLYKNPAHKLKDSFDTLKKNISIPANPIMKTNVVNGTNKRIEELEKLVRMREAGNISDEEYHQLKSKIL